MPGTNELSDPRQTWHGASLAAIERASAALPVKGVRAASPRDRFPSATTRRIFVGYPVTHDSVLSPNVCFGHVTSERDRPAVTTLRTRFPPRDILAGSYGYPLIPGSTPLAASRPVTPVASRRLLLATPSTLVVSQRSGHLSSSSSWQRCRGSGGVDLPFLPRFHCRVRLRGPGPCR